jgi:hypothetical protein
MDAEEAEEVNAGATKYTKFPQKLTALLNAIYKSRCSGANCGGHVTTTTHLKEAHGYHIDVGHIMDMYQNGKGGLARIAISHDIAFVEAIKIAKAPKV